MAITQNEIDIQWTASTDNVGVVGYDIFINGVFEKSVGNILETQLTGLFPSTDYSIIVKGKDAQGNKSVDSNTLEVTTAAGDDIPAKMTITSIEHTDNPMKMTITSIV